jgi:hypothetical protein
MPTAGRRELSAVSPKDRRETAGKAAGDLQIIRR